MTSSDAARLTEAFRLLQSGRAAEALTIAQSVASAAPAAADPLHMLALCRKALGDDAGALTAFEAALARAPRDPNLLGNYANFLSRTGRHADAIALYRRAIEAQPAHADAWTNLGLALRDVGDVAGAVAALERAVALRPNSATAWQGLGSARRASGDLAGAEVALRRCVQLAPGNGAAWTNLGVVRRLLGDPADALECYAAARRAGFAGAELEDAEASAWLDLGETERALAGVRRLIASAPGYVAGHAMLAHILWEHGATVAPGEDPRAAFRAAVEAQPQNRPLGKAFISFLLDAVAADEALQHARAMRAVADEPVLMANEALALEMLGRIDEAGALFAHAHATLRMEAGFLNFYVRHLLKAGKPDEAAARALEALDREPDNQPALAYLGVAWRLLGDPREDWLCGYDRLIGEVLVEPPPGFEDEASFLMALEATLLPMHKATREPVNQSLRGGSQTPGVLFGRRDPVIAATRDAIARAVARHIERLPDDATHPFLRRKSPKVRFVGSWSVRLWSSGKHINHFHQEGWLSSAFYVSLPPSVLQSAAGDTAGCIQFGEPPPELALGLAPRRVIRPRPGQLALFPSYIWHGTVPFHDDAPRLTIAFDAQPA
jgi:tetratricopeptide (TPR) repeat protein